MAAAKSSVSKQLQFKFSEDSEEHERKRLVRSLRGHGATSVRRLFPRSANRMLSSMFIVRYADENAGQQLMRILRRSESVEFAEPKVSRKLV